MTHPRCGPAATHKTSTAARAIAGWLLAAACGTAAAQGLAPAEIQARNAASSYVITNLATLAMLRQECDSALGAGPDGAAAIARGWWDRNLPDIETAYVWADRYLAALKDRDAAEYQKARMQLGAGTHEAVRKSAVKFFRGQVPAEAACRNALKLFADPQADIQRIGQKPGTERLGDFGRTLGRIRAEAGYQVPPHVRVDPERSLRYTMVASLEVAQSAVARGDADAARVAYESMAARGDGKAAQQLGTMYVSGGLLPQNDAQAYRWFFRAWVLKEPEGANALGVMQRDGRAGPAQPRLALALFQLAVAQAGDEPRTRARAQRNIQGLSDKLSTQDRTATACMTLGEIANAVVQPLPEAERGDSAPSPDAHKRLGDFLPSVTGGVPLFCG